jgi:glucose-6-phosphate 1-dehydrogenase
MIEAGWAAIQPILDAWAAGKGGELDLYAAGSEGPQAADDLIRIDGRAWRPF